MMNVRMYNIDPDGDPTPLTDELENEEIEINEEMDTQLSNGNDQ